MRDMQSVWLVWSILSSYSSLKLQLESRPPKLNISSHFGERALDELWVKWVTDPSDILYEASSSVSCLAHDFPHERTFVEFFTSSLLRVGDLDLFFHIGEFWFLMSFQGEKIEYNNINNC